jgi:hypothetical protein
MEPQTQQKANLRDIFINLGAFVALYTVLYSILNLLFTVINTAYPQVNAYGSYSSSSSISMPVATLIIFFPIFVWLMWLVQRGFSADPATRNNRLHKWLTYITLFISGLTLAGDLVTIVYYFIDGQELTAGFLLKFLAVLIIALGVFLYFISDIRGRLTRSSEKIWMILATVVVIGSIIWGFAVLGSPRSQRLVKYDQEKVSSLQSMTYLVSDYYQQHGTLPESFADLPCAQSYNNSGICVDHQTNMPYEYVLIGQSAKAYQLCATFNKANDSTALVSRYPYSENSWSHPAGHYCFSQSIPVSQYKPVPDSNPVPKAIPAY